MSPGPAPRTLQQCPGTSGQGPGTAPVATVTGPLAEHTHSPSVFPSLYPSWQPGHQDFGTSLPESTRCIVWPRTPFQLPGASPGPVWSDMPQIELLGSLPSLPSFPLVLPISIGALTIHPVAQAKNLGVNHRLYPLHTLQANQPWVLCVGCMVLQTLPSVHSENVYGLCSLWTGARFESVRPPMLHVEKTSSQESAWCGLT